MRRLAIAVAAFGACVPAPDFRGVTIGTDAPARGHVSITVLAYDGPLADAAVVFVDPDGTRQQRLTNAEGVAEADVLAGANVFVGRTLDNKLERRRSLTAVLAIEPGDHVIVGEPLGPVELATLNVELPVRSGATTYVVHTECSDGAFDASTNVVPIQETDRCRNRPFTLIAQTFGNGVQYIGTIAAEAGGRVEVAATWNPSVRVELEVTGIPAGIERLWVNIESELERFSGGISERAIEADNPTLAVIGEADVAPFGDSYLLLSEVDHRVYRGQWVEQRIPRVPQPSAPLAPLAPWIGPVTFANGTLSWPQEGATHQLRIIDGSYIRESTSTLYEWRIIAPGAATGELAWPTIPDELDEYVLRTGEEPRFEANLFRFDDAITYREARAEADIRSNRGNYTTRFLGVPGITNVAHSGTDW